MKLMCVCAWVGVCVRGCVVVLRKDKKAGVSILGY